MKWPIQIRFPRVFGWETLAFADRLKLLALFFQVGGGVIMTAMAGYALVMLAHNRAIWPVFYLGATALLLVGIVLTGFGALLYRRTVDFKVGPVSFKTSDQESAPAMIQQLKDIQDVQRTMGQGGDGGLGRPIVGNAGTVSIQTGGDQPSGDATGEREQDRGKPDG